MTAYLACIEVTQVFIDLRDTYIWRGIQLLTQQPEKIRARHWRAPAYVLENEC